MTLVGAGPGDPGLVTVRGRRALRRADVVAFDRLVPAELLREAPPTARRIDVGKAPGRKPWPQSRINAMLVAEARRGRRVVRLKGGDAYVFGRGGEEGLALHAAGIPFRVVPGVTSAVAAPALAGIPVTHRGTARSFAVITGHDSDGKLPSLDWEALACIDTLIVLMGLGQLEHLVARLLAAGRSPATPVAVVARAGMPGQSSVIDRLDNVTAAAAGLPSPATIVVGAVVDLAPRLAPSVPAALCRAGHVA